MITTQLSRGTLLRLRRGVFLGASAWPDDPEGQHLMRARAEVVVHPRAVISRQSAAVLWGLPSPELVAWHEEPVSVSFPAGGTDRARSVPGAWHVEQLPPDHVVRDAEGYAVTSLCRTAIDLAAGRPFPDAMVILDGAARRLCESFVVRPRRSDYANGRYSFAARSALTGLANARHRTPLLPIIDLVDPVRESAAESLSAGHFAQAGIPTPEFQAAIRSVVGMLYPDFMWREQQLIGECDGAVKYADASSIVREKEREQLLRDMGYRIVRWQAKEIMLRPRVVVERVARALGA